MHPLDSSEEIHYNSGVIAFRQRANILYQWAKAVPELHEQLPGDQEILSRTISTHQPRIIELSPLYNWRMSWGPNEDAVIHHFSGGPAKLEIFKSYDSGLSPQEMALVSNSFKSLVQTF